MFVLTPRLCRAARSLLGWGIQNLADASGISRFTIGAFEGKGEEGRLQTMNNRVAVETLEKAGIQFIERNGGGAGVRLREP